MRITVMQSKNTFDITSFDYGVGYDNSGNNFYFDLDDYELIQNYYWRIKQNGYVSTALWDKINKKIVEIQLHRMIMQPEKNKEVDHINQRRYDNRKDNLRIVTTSQNQMNVAVRKNNTSGISGVNWDIATNKWRARICVDGKRISLGCFDDFNDAIQARQCAEKKYFGDYRYDNNINQRYLE